MYRLKSVFLGCLLLCLSVFQAEAQKTVEYRSDWGLKHPSLPDIFILVGNVVFKHEGMLLYADSAHFNTVVNNFDAFQNIKINANDTLFIYGDVLHYDATTKIAQITGKVTLVDDSTVLKTDHLQYDRNLSLSTYPNWGVTTDKGSRLFSKKGYYYNLEKTFYFKDSVRIESKESKIFSDTLRYCTKDHIAHFFGPTHIYNKENYIYTEWGWYNTELDISESTKNSYLKNKSQTLTADYINYDQKLKYGHASGNVVLVDSANNVILKGEKSITNNRRNYSLMTDSATALLVDKNDTLFMHADTIFATHDSTQNFKEVKAYHHMKFYRTDIQGMADSVYYSVQDSLMNMYVNPLIWTGESQLSADTINLLMGSEGLKKAFLESNAFVISLTDTTQKTQYDQVKGRRMIGYVEKGKDLTRVYVEGNAESVYFIREEKEDKTQELIGVNVGLGSDMDIYLEDKKPVRINTLKNPEMTTYPEEQLPMDKRYLKDFKWHSEERPLNKFDIYRKAAIPVILSEEDFGNIFE